MVFNLKIRRANFRVCQGCRSTANYFMDCLGKLWYMWCPRGIQIFFSNDRNTGNKGRLFKTYSQESSSESSIVNEAVNVVANEEFEDLPNMFDSCSNSRQTRCRDFIELDISQGNKMCRGVWKMKVSGLAWLVVNCWTSYLNCLCFLFASRKWYWDMLELCLKLVIRYVGFMCEVKLVSGLMLTLLVWH